MTSDQVAGGWSLVEVQQMQDAGRTSAVQDVLAKRTGNGVWIEPNTQPLQPNSQQPTASSPQPPAPSPQQAVSASFCFGLSQWPARLRSHQLAGLVLRPRPLSASALSTSPRNIGLPAK
jgi:hypothetical protein